MPRGNGGRGNGNRGNGNDANAGQQSGGRRPGGGGGGGGTTVTRPGGGGAGSVGGRPVRPSVTPTQTSQNLSAPGPTDNGGYNPANAPVESGGGSGGGGGGATAPTKTGQETKEVANGNGTYDTVTYDIYSDGSRVEVGRVANTARRNVYNDINLTLQEASWGVDLTQWLPIIDKWIADGVADASNGEEIIVKMLSTSKETLPNSTQTVSDLFNQRFPGFAAANTGGQNMTLAEYRQFEQGAISAMQRYNLPTEMYDNPADLAKLVTGRVSLQEVDDRIATAKRALDSSDPSVVDAFQRYYGVGRGDLLAYMLDGEKGQKIIEQRAKTAEIGGSAARYGFTLSEQQASGFSNQGLLGSMSGTNSALRGQAEQYMSQAADLRDQDTRLSAIDKEDYSANDAIDTVFGDRNKELKSQKRAERETARFKGSSGVTATSLSRRAI